MADLERVITNLQIIRTWAEVDGESGRGIDPQCCGKIVEWIDDALAMLKAQEPVMVSIVNNGFTGLPVTYCPKCHRLIDMFYEVGGGETNFCPNCGQAVKWDG